MRSIIVFLILLLSAPISVEEEYSPSEYELVKWETETCSCHAKVDIKKLNPEIIFHIVEDFRSFETAKKFDWLDFRDAKIEQLKSERELFKQEANKQIRRLINLKLPAIPLIKKYHTQAVRGFQVDAHLYLAELDFLITGNTAELKKDFLGEKLSTKCKNWAQALESKEDTYEILPKLIEQKCSNNANPRRCEEKSLAKTLNDFRSAQSEILIFGWYNCANYQYRKDELYDYMYKALNALDPYLREKVCECDEP